MTERVVLQKLAANIQATGVVALEQPAGHSVKKIPTRGHPHWALTTKTADVGAAPSVIVKLKGTNNSDEAGTAGEDLITNTHAAADQQDGKVANVPYAYVFVHVTTRADLDLEDIRLVGTGYAGR